MKSKLFLLATFFLLISCVINRATKPMNSDSVDNKTLEKGILDPRNILPYVEQAQQVESVKNTNSSFDTLQYNKVIAYDFDGSHEKYPIFSDRTKYNLNIFKQHALSQKQTDKILKDLNKKSTYGGTQSACFEPRFAIVLYNNTKIVCQINICLDCNSLICDIPIPAESANILKIRGMDESYPLEGFSKKGRKRIVELCKELNFTYGDY